MMLAMSQRMYKDGPGALESNPCGMCLRVMMKQDGVILTSLKRHHFISVGHIISLDSHPQNDSN